MQCFDTWLNTSDFEPIKLLLWNNQRTCQLLESDRYIISQEIGLGYYFESELDCDSKQFIDRDEDTNYPGVT